jgi:hypothetical protein
MCAARCSSTRSYMLMQCRICAQEGTMWLIDATTNAHQATRVVQTAQLMLYSASSYIHLMPLSWCCGGLVFAPCCRRSKPRMKDWGTEQQRRAVLRSCGLHVVPATESEGGGGDREWQEAEHMTRTSSRRAWELILGGAGRSETS